MDLGSTPQTKKKTRKQARDQSLIPVEDPCLRRWMQTHGLSTIKGAAVVIRFNKEDFIFLTTSQPHNLITSKPPPHSMRLRVSFLPCIFVDMWIRLISTAFIILLVLWGCAESPPAASGPDGQAIYTRHCVLCHGADGRRGLNGAGDLTTSALPLDIRIDQITHGKGLMTPYAGILTPEEIEAVARFTLTLTPP